MTKEEMASPVDGWKTSTYSGAQGGSECVEINTTRDAAVYLRDSKNRHGGTLCVSRDAWCNLIGLVHQ